MLYFINVHYLYHELGLRTNVHIEYRVREERERERARLTNKC